MDLIATHVRTIEVADIEARLSVLEKERSDAQKSTARATKSAEQSARAGAGKGEAGPSDTRTDPAFDEACRRDQERLCALLRKRNAPCEYGGPLTDAETQELESLQGRPRVNFVRRFEGGIFDRGKRLREALRALGEEVNRRFKDLETKVVEGQCDAAEQEEVKLLRETYGVSPRDDPDFETVMAWRRAAQGSAAENERLRLRAKFLRERNSGKA